MASVKCTYCVKTITKYPSEIRKTNFCDRTCKNEFQKSSDFKIWNRGLRGLQTAWNQGLTKYDNSSLMRMSKSMQGNTLTLGLKHSDEIRRKMSESIRQTYVDGRVPIGHTYGIRSYMWNEHQRKEVCFRSSYERQLAEILNKSEIVWEYEPKVFDLGSTTYRPDFYLPEQDRWIEVKGWWTVTAKKKFDLFKKMNPELDIVVMLKQDLVEDYFG